jgi:hypothetical protein
MENKFDLTDFFITKNQATSFIQSIEIINDQLYEVNFNLEKALSNQFGIEKKDKFITFLREQNINNSSNDDLKKFLTSVQENIRKLPVLSITLAFEPDDKTLKAIVEWFLFNLNRQILLDISVDKKIIAGASINFKGKYKDYSVKPLFENMINKEVIKNIDKNNSNGVIKSGSNHLT